MTHDTSAPPLPTADGAAPQGSRSAWRVLAVVLSLALVAWGALAVVSLLARESTHSSATFRGVTRVQVDLGFGSLDIRGSATASDVELRRSSSWSLTKPHTSATTTGGTLVVSSSCGFNIGRGCTGRVSLVVPDHLPVSLRAGDGSVVLRDLHGPVDATTSDGSVDASGLSGRLRLQLSDGSLDARGLRSQVVTAASSDGSIRLGFAVPPSRVTVSSNDGSVAIMVPHDRSTYRVSAEVSDGHRTVSVPTDPAADRRIAAQTNDGSIDIRTDR
jgi:putative adhesin